MAKPKISKAKRGKRKFFPIVAPKLFNEQEIGQSFVYDSELLSGKHLTINLMQLTGNPSKQNMSVFFRVDNVAEGKGHARLIGMEMQSNSMRRVVRRGRSKVADSFLARNKHQDVVRIKPIIMTRSRTSGDVQTALRAKCRDVLREILGTNSMETIVDDIIHMRLQKHLKHELTSIFPVRSVDIRSISYTKAQIEAAEEDLTPSSYVKAKPKPVAQDNSELKSLKEDLAQALEEDDAPSEPEAEPEAKAEEAPAEQPAEQPAPEASEAPAEEKKEE